MAEWFNAAVLKTVEGASPPGVQIPFLPPKFVSYRFEKARSALSKAGFFVANQSCNAWRYKNLRTVFVTIPISEERGYYV